MTLFRERAWSLIKKEIYKENKDTAVRSQINSEILKRLFLKDIICECA